MSDSPSIPDWLKEPTPSETPGGSNAPLPDWLTSPTPSEQQAPASPPQYPPGWVPDWAKGPPGYSQQPTNSDQQDPNYGAGSAILDPIVKDVGTGLTEIPRAIAHGVIAGVDAVRQDFTDFGNAVGAGVGVLTGTSAYRHDVTTPSIPNVGEPTSVTGRIVSGAAQFTAGFAITTALTGGAGDAAAIGKAGMAGINAVRGGITMATFFDPQAQRLSNLVQNTQLANPVTEFLQTKPGDSNAEGRFKNALEGMGMSLAIGPFIAGVSAVRSWLQGDTQGALDAAKLAASGGTKPDIVDQPGTAVAKSGTDFTMVQPEGPAVQPAPEGNTYRVKLPEPALSNVNSSGIPEIRPATAYTDDELGSIGQQFLLQGLSGTILPAAARDPALGLINLTRTTPLDAAMSPWFDQNNLLVERLYNNRIDELGIDPVQSHSTLLQDALPLAGLTWSNPDHMLMYLAQTTGDIDSASKAILAMRLDQGVRMDAMSYLAKSIIEGSAGPDAMPKFQNLAATWAQFAMMDKDAGQAAGRLLASRAISVGADPALAKLIGEALQNASGSNEGRWIYAAKVLANSNGSPQSVNNITRGIFDSTIRPLASFFVNGMLGYPTLVKKAGSDFLNAFVLQPANQFARSLVSAARGDLSGAAMDFRQGLALSAELTYGVKDFLSGGTILQRSKDAFYQGKQLLDAGGGNGWADTPGHAMPFAIGDGSVLAAFVRRDFGTAVMNSFAYTSGLPSRLINGLHEASTQIIYRAKVQSDAFREALEMGLNESDTQAHMDQRLNEAFSPNGSAFDENGQPLNPRALQYAREGTFTQGIDDIPVFGRLLQAVQDSRTQHPALQFLIPFWRAPVNLLRAATNLSGVPSAVNVAKSAINGTRLDDGELAKLTVAAMTWTGIGTLAMHGMITVRGSDDPGTAHQQQMDGWRPHSFVWTNADGSKKYIDYEPAEPFGTLLSLAADAHDLNARGISNADRDSIGVQMVTALSKDYFQKSFLPTISNLFTLIDGVRNDGDADRQFGRFFGNMAGALIPGSISRTNEDPYMREVRSVIDGIRSRTPGQSQYLDPQRNVLGEPVARTNTLGPSYISPYRMSSSSPDAVDREMAQQALMNPHGFKNPSPIWKPHGDLGPGIDLRTFSAPNGKTAYDYMQEQLATSHPDGTPSLRDQIRMTISSPQYQALPTGGTSDYRGARYGVLSKLIEANRKEAQGRMIADIPAVAQAGGVDAANAAKVLMGEASKDIKRPTGGR